MLDHAPSPNLETAPADASGGLTVRWTAGLLAGSACLVSAAALFGYLRHEPALVHLHPGWQGMSPVTSLGMIAAGCAVIAQSLRSARAALAAAALALVVGVTVLLLYALAGGDTLSVWLAAGLFGTGPATTGRTSIATAGCLLALGAANLPRRPAYVGDAAAALGLVVSGVALLGYAYGVRDLYAVPLFRTMGLNTALAAFLLSVGSILANPRAGWASVIASTGGGGDTTRRQLAFLALPPIAGWLLLRATSASTLGPGAAMALLVVVTVVPLAVLILRDGRSLNALAAERRTKVEFQASVRRELERRLSEQAGQLSAESAERERAEAALHRAQRMEAVGQLTGGIAHDFNNLLMAVGGNLQLLTRRLAEDHPARRYALSATDAVNKGAKLTSQLLAFSRTQKLQARAVEIDPVLVSARALIGSALGPLVEVRMELGAPGGWASTDPDQLELAVLNLALNARDAMPAGGVLTIRSGACRARLSSEGDEGDYLSVRLSDTGEGMSSEVAGKAVEPFFTTKERGKGTGLGLAQVYGFVRQCGGDLRIDSAPGQGASVLLLFPCARAPDEAELAEASSETGPGRPASEGRRRSLLVIDDDDSVRAVLVDALRGAGYEVTEARDGQSGLDALERLQPSAAIIDFIMPGMNGAEVARRARLIMPGLPVVFVSGYFDTAALDGISGALIVRKPIDLDGLQRTVSSVLH